MTNCAHSIHTDASGEKNSENNHGYGLTRKSTELTKAERAAFGKRLRKLRESRAWSQETLAAASGVSQAMLSTLEASAKQPGWDTVCRLADALEIGVQDFR